MNVVLTIFIFIFIALIDLPSLINNKRHKALGAYLAFLGVTLTLCCLEAAGVVFPSPFEAMGYFFREVLKIAYPA